MSTLADLFAETIRDHEERPAIHSPGRTPLSYGQLGRQIEAVRGALTRAGFGRHQRIGIVLPHGPEFPVAIAAVCSACVGAPLSEQLPEQAAAELIRAMRLDALLIDEGADTGAARAARGMSVPLLRMRVRAEAPAGTFELLAPPSRVPVQPEPAGPSDLAIITHTSGTTGAPKLIPFEHWRLVEDVRARNRMAGTFIGPGDRCLYVSPFSSMAATRHGMLRAFSAGGSLICPTSVDVATLVSLIETMKPTLLLAAPAVQTAIVDEFERRQQRPAHALRFVEAAFTELSASLKQRLERILEVPVVAVYGMSEAGLISRSPLPPERVPAGSVGRPCNVEVAVADDDGGLLPPGEQGEIIVRGPQVFAGYENNEPANRQAFRDGWFRTGDLGRIDTDGFLFVTGRIKDIINRGGTKIAPGDVEAAILEHPQVAEAAAFGVAHPTLGEDAVVGVVLRNPRTTEGELRRFLRSRLAASKMPSRVVVLPQLPRGELDKIDRRKLADLAQHADAERFEAPATREEAEVARIFADVLGVASVGRHDNFFNLGGDSLRGVRVLVEAESSLGASLSLDVLFDHPTVAAFASRAAEAAGTRGAPRGRMVMNTGVAGGYEAEQG